MNHYPIDQEVLISPDYKLIDCNGDTVKDRPKYGVVVAITKTPSGNIKYMVKIRADVKKRYTIALGTPKEETVEYTAKSVDVEMFGYQLDGLCDEAFAYRICMIKGKGNFKNLQEWRGNTSNLSNKDFNNMKKNTVEMVFQTKMLADVFVQGVKMMEGKVKCEFIAPAVFEEVHGKEEKEGTKTVESSGQTALDIKS